MPYPIPASLTPGELDQQSIESVTRQAQTIDVANESILRELLYELRSAEGGPVEANRLLIVGYLLDHLRGTPLATDWQVDIIGPDYRVVSEQVSNIYGDLVERDIFQELPADITSLDTVGTAAPAADWLLLHDVDDAANPLKKVHPDDLGISGAGESNTASNVGTGGVGVFKQKTGVDLEFKKINAADAKITVADDVGNNEVDIGFGSVASTDLSDAATINADTVDGLHAASFAAASHTHEGTAILSTGPVTDGYVLTADGAGGAAWEVSAGGAGNTFSTVITEPVSETCTADGVDQLVLKEGASGILTIDALATTDTVTFDVAANSIGVGYMHATQTDVFFGRDTAAAGAGEEITMAAARTMLNVANGANVTTSVTFPANALITGNGGQDLTYTQITALSDAGTSRFTIPNDDILEFQGNSASPITCNITNAGASTMSLTVDGVAVSLAGHTQEGTTILSTGPVTSGWVLTADGAGGAAWGAPGTGVTDHGALTGLADDDHGQYHNDARGDARYYTETELDAGQLDNRYFTEAEHLNVSAGAGDAGKPVKLDAGGQIDATMINDADIDITATTGTLTTGRGGTGITSPGAASMLIGFGGSWIELTKGAAVTGHFLQLDGSGYPDWAATLGVANGGTGLTACAAGDIVYASAANTLAVQNITEFGAPADVASDDVMLGWDITAAAMKKYTVASLTLNKFKDQGRVFWIEDPAVNDEIPVGHFLNDFTVDSVVSVCDSTGGSSTVNFSVMKHAIGEVGDSSGTAIMTDQAIEAGTYDATGWNVTVASSTTGTFVTIKITAVSGSPSDVWVVPHIRVQT